MNPTSTPVIVELVGPDQWKRVKALRLASLREDPQSFFKLVSEEIDLTEADWRARLEPANTWLAVFGGVDVGLVTSSPNWDDRNAAHLSGLWVAHPARRTGAARLLSGTVVDHARSAGFALMVLWVASANPGADQLYTGLGFTRTGRTDTFEPPRDLYTEWTLELMIAPGMPMKGLLVVFGFPSARSASLWASSGGARPTAPTRTST